MQLGDHLSVWWVGGMIHLWFLPALMVAVLILGLCQQARLPRLALLLGPCSTPWPDRRLLWPAAAGGEWALLTRNGPFFSLLFVALGAELRLRAWQPDARRCALMMMAGMGLYALEAAGLLRVAAVPSLVMISCWVRSPGRWGCSACCWPTRMGQRQLAGAPGPKVLGLYCLHMMLVVWLMIFGPQGKQVWWELLKVPALLALTLLGYRLLAATALSRWLLRAR